jgi:hypothetical protein
LLDDIRIDLKEVDVSVKNLTDLARYRVCWRLLVNLRNLQYMELVALHS